jgi:pyruvate/2-oxoglutarate dehydrogenase complex dihydrolipoamide dehydrogenase (E3) component
MPTRYDALVIGTGQAGPSLAVDLAKAGRTVAVIERHRFGGTCVNTGCTPTKAMVACAQAAHIVRRAGDWGVRLSGAVSVDLHAVKARTDGIVSKSSSGVEGRLRKTEGVTVYKGHGRFEHAHAVRVGDDVLEADQVFLDVGGRPAVPDMPGLAEVDFLTNSSMVALERLPEHLVVVGGSYVGLEFAQMFRRFGSEVTVVERGGRLIAREDEDVSDAVREILEAEGITVRLNANCLDVSKHPDGVVVSVNCEEGAPEVLGSHVLLAVGRHPNTDDLGVGEAGLELDEKGFVVVDDELRTSVPGIWALGECNGHGAFTHTSYNDYEIVSANLLRGEARRLSDRILTYGLFIDPPLGRVGITETQARTGDRDVLVATMPMSKVSRAIEKGETAGFMKILVDATSKEVLGASILGVGGDEAIHLVTDVIYAKAPYTAIQRAVHIHPTVAELIPTLLGQLAPLQHQ